MRPILRPGTHVLRRGGGELQVGLDPRSALLLPATPAVAGTLRALARPADPSVCVDADTVELLATHGLLLDERDLSRGTSAVPVARQRARISTHTFGHPVGAGLREQFLALTAAAGIQESAARRTGPVDCGILLGVGEPDRRLVDAWTRGATPYLLVRMTEGRAVVGPFVLPGTTACLRCVDAHCTDADPAWPLLVQQYSSLSTRDRPDGATEPVDPLLAALVLAWAARDVASYVDGGRPSTWSATVTLHPGLTSLETQEWLRHPGCGCSWDLLDRST